MNLNLPPRVKTQQQTLRNAEEITPIPLETVFFLEDGERDSTRMNRYYFNFPGNWVTSNNGENIVGLRSIKSEKFSKKIEFTMKIAKYKKKDYEDDFFPPFRVTLDEIVDYMISENKKAQMKEFKVVYYLDQDTNGYDDFFKTVHNTFKTYISTWWLTTDIFKQSDDNPMDRDMQFEGYYDNRGYHIKIFSQRHNNEDDLYDVVYKITSVNNDFKDLFEFNQLNTEWLYDLTFDNVWDLKPCHVHSSIAEQSSHHYIGTTDIEYHTIKYFKLNSSDQRFWLEFYSMGKKNTPSYFPPFISFRIEIQFQSFNKILNI